MLLRLGIVVVAVLLAIFFLNSLLEIIISILMIGIVYCFGCIGGIIFSSTEQLDDYRKYFQMKIKELKLKLRIKSME